MWPISRQQEASDCDNTAPSTQPPSSRGLFSSNLSSITDRSTDNNFDSTDKIPRNDNKNNNIKERIEVTSSKASPFNFDSNDKPNTSKNTSANQASIETLNIPTLQQAMQVAYLQQHQGSGLKGTPFPFSPDEDDSSRSVQSMAAALVAAGGSSNSGLPSQIQQLLSQQSLVPQQLQSLLQQQAAISAQQQRQAQKVHEFYRQQQQKNFQGIQIQLAAAKHQKTSSSEEVTPSTDPLNNGSTPKPSKDHHQLQQQLALHQLMQLQQMQQQQQQQQQAAAAAAIQQHSLAAAMAMAQSRQQNYMSPDLTNDFQQLLMKHVNDATQRKDVVTSFPFSDDVMTSGTTSHLENRENACRSSSNRSRGSTPDSPFSHPLYSHGSCNWPGCDAQCSDVTTFYTHLHECHTLDDKSTAQYRVQLEVVEQLEKQLLKERERLDAMMTHLKMEGKTSQNGMDSADIVSASTPNKLSTSIGSKPSSEVLSSAGFSGIPLPFGTSSHQVSVPSSLSLPTSPNPSSRLPGLPQALFPTSSSPPLFGSHLSTLSRDGMHPSKRRHSGAVPISTELTQNQEFYRNADVRPPYTYASLIRQAIIEAPDCQMTLNEIYNWFQKKFAYFRRNAPTWKTINRRPPPHAPVEGSQISILLASYADACHEFAVSIAATQRLDGTATKNAVRHNLSLHKCFVRVENVKGAVWTVDEGEYQKRRPQKYSGSPAIRGRMENGQSPSFYPSSMSIAAMQMALGDTSFSPSQLANHTQAFLAPNQLPNYSSFLQNNFGGLPQNLTVDGLVGINQSESSITNGKIQSVSPTLSNVSHKDEKPRCDYAPLQTSINPKTEETDPNHKYEERKSVSDESTSESGKTRTTPKIKNNLSGDSYAMILDHPTE